VSIWEHRRICLSGRKHAEVSLPRAVGRSLFHGSDAAPLERCSEPLRRVRCYPGVIEIETLRNLSKSGVVYVLNARTANEPSERDSVPVIGL
jgi:hypothetical protein